MVYLYNKDLVTPSSNVFINKNTMRIKLFNIHIIFFPLWRIMGGLKIFEFQTNAVLRSSEDQMIPLSYLESLAIKDQKPALNTGIKSAKDLSLF